MTAAATRAAAAAGIESHIGRRRRSDPASMPTATDDSINAGSATEASCQIQSTWPCTAK